MTTPGLNKGNEMNKLVIGLSLAALAGIVAGCASTPVQEKVQVWQVERPYAQKIQEIRNSGRRLMSRDVDLVFTMEDFKKELPDCAASLDAVLAIGKTALNIVAEVGNTSSPLYAAAVDSVDRKWAEYVGRDVETDAGGDIEKYLASVEEKYREQTRKDWELYQKVVKYVPDNAILEKGKKVCEKFTKDDGNGKKTLDVLGIEQLPYNGGEADYNAFCVYRDNTPEIAKMYDDEVLAKLNSLMAKIQAQMNDLLAAAQKLKEDPEVAKLNMIDLAKTLKGVGVGIGAAFADPLGKVGSAIKGYSLAGEVEKLAKTTQQKEQNEAGKSAKD